MLFVPVCLAIGIAQGAPEWSVALTGDLMFNQIPVGANSLVALEPELRRASLAIANLEVPLTTSPSRTARKTAADLRARRQFILAGDPRHIAEIAEAHIRMVSLGNNHAMDRGPGGLAEMSRSLDAAGIAHAGAGSNIATARSVAVVKLGNGYRIGMISALAFSGSKALWTCTPAGAKSPGVTALDFHGIPDRAAIRAWIADARTKCNFLIVALHGGIERQALPSSYQVSLARAFVDEGADLVWGNHPHVLEGAELYRGVPILYSCGNLVSPTPAATAVFRLAFSGKRFLHMKFVPCTVRGGRVAPSTDRAAQGARFRMLESLLHRRFPAANSAPLEVDR